MSEYNGDREGFLTRWSRRKREPDPGLASRPDATPDATPEATPEASPDAASPQKDDAFAGFDFESLSFDSDYRRFMADAVPENAQRMALRRLWTSTDIIARADELDDYLEDFREEAMALPAEMVRSAYRVGRGFVEDGQETDVNGTDEEVSAPLLSDGQPESVSATATVDKRGDNARCGSETSGTVSDTADKTASDSDKS